MIRGAPCGRLPLDVLAWCVWPYTEVLPTAVDPGEWPQLSHAIGRELGPRWAAIFERILRSCLTSRELPAVSTRSMCGSGRGDDYRPIGRHVCTHAAAHRREGGSVPPENGARSMAILASAVARVASCDVVLPCTRIRMHASPCGDSEYAPADVCFIRGKVLPKAASPANRKNLLENFLVASSSALVHSFDRDDATTVVVWVDMKLSRIPDRLSGKAWIDVVECS